MIGMPDPKRGHRPVYAHDQRMRSGALGKIASTIGCRSGPGALGRQFLPSGRPVGRDGDLFDRLGHASHAFGDPADGVTIKRQIDEGFDPRRNLVKREIDGKRRDRLRQRGR